MLRLLLLALPIAIACEYLGASAVWRFLFAGLAAIPLAGELGKATEDLTETVGPGLGGFLNASLGNAAELIIAIVALREGPKLYPLVKASITGSIVGNVLLVLGMSFTLGGVKYKEQSFNKAAASAGSTLLAMAAIGLVIPAVFHHIAMARSFPHGTERVEHVSFEIAVILIVVYVLSLVFSLKTHKHLFGMPEPHHAHTASEARKLRTRALIRLTLATAAIAYTSEIFVGSAEEAAAAFGMNHIFIGVFVVAIVGNAAEHSTAMLMALKNKIGVALTIAVGSSVQIALFVAPLLVFASMAINPGQPLDLHFTILEVLSVVVSMLILSFVCQDGESNWLEGVMMFAVYVMLGVAFYNLP